MRHVGYLIVTVILLNNLCAKKVNEEDYYRRLYYTAKVWGYVKYFHTSVAAGFRVVNWDNELLTLLDNIKGDSSNEDYNKSLIGLLNSAGKMAVRDIALPDVPDSMKFNLDLSWINDFIFSDSVQAALDTIKVRFRPQSNFYIGEVWSGGNANFDNDKQYYISNDKTLPDEDLRLLALFRYWNIINYLYPYKNLMDQNWDSTLVEFIPKILNADNARSYNTVFLRLATRLNDTHAYTFRGDNGDNRNLLFTAYFKIC